MGYTTVPEAATSVIACAQSRGTAEPWTEASFIDEIVALQRARQEAASGEVQVYDRSPVCTYALAVYLGFPVSRSLASELDRVGSLYEREVFFVRNLGFVEPSAARRISFAESLVFERIHEESYRAFGYTLIDIPAASIADRTSQILALVNARDRGRRR